MRDRIWHFTFSHWYDNRAAGNTRRAKAWGNLHDELTLLMWPLHRSDGTRRFS